MVFRRMDFTSYQIDILQRYLNKRIDGAVYVIEVDTKGFSFHSDYSDIAIRLPRELTGASRGLGVYLYRINSIKIKNRQQFGRSYFCKSGVFGWHFYKNCDNLNYYTLCDSPKAAAEYVRYALSNNWKFKGKKLKALVDFFDLEVNVRW